MAVLFGGIASYIVIGMGVWGITFIYDIFPKWEFSILAGLFWPLTFAGLLVKSILSFGNYCLGELHSELQETKRIRKLRKDSIYFED